MKHKLLHKKGKKISNCTFMLIFNLTLTIAPKKKGKLSFILKSKVIMTHAKTC